MIAANVLVDEYFKALPDERRQAMNHLRELLLNNLPQGYEEAMAYKMPSYVVPHALYPSGYHCDSKLPLPFINLASQKSHIAVYHMGIYADPELLNWFQTAYAAEVKGKLDMGKSCIRFKKPELIPYGLFAELASKMSVQNWISLYEKNYKKS
jgi:uncharacterized protein YdhG (YjbR/CyaY superfamily)